MKPKKPGIKRPAAPKVAAKPEVKSAQLAPVELDRRGKPLPSRQRVGGIITPQ